MRRLTDANPVGVREQKKERTRARLIEVGLWLFRDQGFDETTTEHIAHAAAVSQRTLFRYFETKSDLALAPHRQWQQDFLRVLANRPSAEPAWSALIKAAEDVLRHLDDRRIAEQAALGQLVAATPALLAAFARHDDAFQLDAVEVLMNRRAELVAEPGREAVGVTVAAFSALDRFASRQWFAEAVLTPQARIDVQRRCARELLPALCAAED